MALSLHHLDPTRPALTHRKTVKKFERTLAEYARVRFEPVGGVEGVRVADTTEHHKTPPESGGGVRWEDAVPGQTMWGGGWRTSWFAGDLRIPKEASGRKLWLAFDADMERREGLLYIDGQTRGTYTSHHPAILVADAKASKKLAGGESMRVAAEMYGGNAFPGDHAHSRDAPPPVGIPKAAYRGWTLLAEREDVTAFLFDLQTLMQLRELSGYDDLIHHRATRTLAEVMVQVVQMPEEVDQSVWRPGLKEARETMRPVLEAHNGTIAPTVGLLGHSHIDTAWHWPISETRRKCRRTFSSVLNLMDQYPEMTFLQSATAHTEMVRQDDPDLFERIRAAVKSGRWEPNGGMWVEPDCNIPSGESLVRQFLVGQRLTREWYGYTSDTMWQPDVFGYSAALPQILRGCGIEFFCTTKLSWNDTTRFPRDTFHWEGLDGTAVLAHFQIIQGTPDAETLCELWQKHVIHKEVQDRILFPYGWGDGGGGPKHEMLELARRVGDLQGVPRTHHTTLSKFMNGLRDDLAADLPLYSGELYLEMHRGTLTSIAKIKRGNRKCEAAIRDAEFLGVMGMVGGEAGRDAGMEGQRDGGESEISDLKSQILNSTSDISEYPADRLNALWRRLLTNQFHDILPGSSIDQVNDEAVADFEALERELGELNAELLSSFSREAQRSAPAGNGVTLVNSLSWPRRGTLRLAGEPSLPSTPEVQDASGPKASPQRRREHITQQITDPAGDTFTLLHGPVLPPLSVGGGEVNTIDLGNDAFTLEDDDTTVRTPHLTARFDDRGRIESLVHAGRELVHGGGVLNRLVFGQDAPHVFDNWDIDIDQARHMRDDAELVSREVIARGPLQIRIRQTYKVGRNSRLVQDVVFHADRAMVEFDSVIEWDEKHVLLQAEFDINVAAREATHEVQFGHLRRPMHDNTDSDRAQFEVAQQRWTDVSDAAFGVALLNDCKYGVSAHTRRLHGLRRHGSHTDLADDASAQFRDAGSTLGLTLMKSGTHPDPRGDAGTHRFRYALLPHQGPVSVESVVRPACEFNLDPLWTASADSRDATPLVEVDTPDLIVDTVKRAEDDDDVILRIYEAGGRSGVGVLTLNSAFKSAALTNMLEEDPEPLEIVDGGVRLAYRPFQVFTLRLGR